MFSERQRDSFKIIAFIVMCVFFFLFHIWLRTQSITEGFRVGAARQKERKLVAELYSLKVEKNALMGPQSLERHVQELSNQGVVFQVPQNKQLHYIENAR